MSGRVLSFSELHSAPIAIAGVGDAAQSIRDNECDLEMETGAGFIGLKCLRGTAFALAAEVATGVSIYGLWKLLHVLR